MMPVKKMLSMSPTLPGPPVLVIDETTIRQTHDAGPVCECDERYCAIQNYKPFLPGGYNPYTKRKVSDADSYEVIWKRLRIGSCGYVFDQPTAIHRSALPENYVPKGTSIEEEFEDRKLVQLPRFSEAYYEEKMRETKREHVEGCNCPTEYK